MVKVAAGAENGRGCRRWRSNSSRKCSPERLTRGTVTSTMRAAHPSGYTGPNPLNHRDD